MYNINEMHVCTIMKNVLRLQGLFEGPSFLGSGTVSLTNIWNVQNPEINNLINIIAFKYHLRKIRLLSNFLYLEKFVGSFK